MSFNAPDAPATLDLTIPRAVETCSPALPHVEAPSTRSPSVVEAIVETMVAVSTTFSASPSSAPTIAEETMHSASPIGEASPTVTLADGVPAISIDANSASPDTASSTGISPVEALFSPIPPPSAPVPASSPSLFLSLGVDTIRTPVESVPAEEEPKRTPTPSPMALPLPDTEALRPLTPPAIHIRTPPAPKVKMSLKDYPLRKQKRKEAAGVNSGRSMSAEGSAAGGVEASPVVATVGLLAEEQERGTKEGAMVVEGRVNGIVVQGSGDGGAQTSPEVISPTVKQNEVPDDEDVEMVHYTPAVVLPPVVLPRPPLTTNALLSTTNPPSTSKSAQNPLLLPTYSRSPFLPENRNLRYRLITHAPTSARRRPGLFPRDQSSELLATSETVPAAALPVVNPSPPLLRPLRHPPLSSSTPTSSSWKSPSMFGRPFTFQAKVELLDQPLPPKLPSNTGVDPALSQHRAQKVNGDTPNRSRPLSERIGPSTEPSPESTPRQRQDPQEEGEVSLGEETPSPQPAPRRIRIDRTRFAPTTVKSPPTGPRALRSASPHRRSFAVPMHQSPPPSSATPTPTPTTPAPPAARVPPTGPRAFRLGLGQQQQQPRVPAPQGWSTMQRELWGKPEWARSRPA